MVVVMEQGENSEESKLPFCFLPFLFSFSPLTGSESVPAEISGRTHLPWRQRQWFWAASACFCQAAGWCVQPGRCCCSSLSSSARMLRVSHSPCSRGLWPQRVVLFTVGTRLRASECVSFGSKSWDTVGSSVATSQPLKGIIDVTSLTISFLLMPPFFVHLTAPTVLFSFFVVIVAFTSWVAKILWDLCYNSNWG